jgi:hypothetical protein
MLLNNLVSGEKFGQNNKLKKENMLDKEFTK